MLLDLLRYGLSPLFAAIIGGVVVHFAARSRDLENARRGQGLDYLLSAYRALANVTHRPLEGETARAFETALADVILLGDATQVELAKQVSTELAEKHSTDLDGLLTQIRE